MQFTVMKFKFCFVYRVIIYLFVSLPALIRCNHQSASSCELTDYKTNFCISGCIMICRAFLFTNQYIPQYSFIVCRLYNQTFYFTIQDLFVIFVITCLNILVYTKRINITLEISLHLIVRC